MVRGPQEASLIGDIKQPEVGPCEFRSLDLDFKTLKGHEIIKGVEQPLLLTPFWGTALLSIVK